MDTVRTVHGLNILREYSSSRYIHTYVHTTTRSTTKAK